MERLLVKRERYRELRVQRIQIKQGRDSLEVRGRFD
jgi:hypothetical protein